MITKKEELIKDYESLLRMMSNSSAKYVKSSIELLTGVIEDLKNLDDLPDKRAFLLDFLKNEFRDYFDNEDYMKDCIEHYMKNLTKTAKRN